MKKEVLVLGISMLIGIAYGVECEYYKVQKGDTLTSIAKSKGVSVKEILSNNKHLDPSKIKAGDKICIPIAEKPQRKKESKKAQEYEYYTVQKGARLKDVAKRLGISLKELEALNPEYKNKFLAKGTRVKVPKRETQPAEEEHGDYEFYTVERGAKLEHISKRLGIPLKTLERLNPEYKGVWLKKGTKVRIPKTTVQKAKREEYDIYTVKRGGRLKDVAKSLGVSLKELEALNPEYKNKFLSRGTKVKVPKESLSEKKEEKKTKHYVMHKVRKGETISSIARRYRISEEELMRINHLKSKKLTAGKHIKIPVAMKEPKEEEKKTSFSERSLEHVPEERQTEPTEIKVLKKSIPMPVEGKVVKSSRGVDILTNCGEPIKSVDDGKVIYSGGDLQAYGNMVIVEHKDFISLYAYNSKNMVKRGDTVSKGQEIASVGKKNNSDECVLHFELRTKDGVPLDPTEYLKNTQ